jgi:uncharacterized repeat protein (TIGR03803 family)
LFGFFWWRFAMRSKNSPRLTRPMTTVAALAILAISMSSLAVAQTEVTIYSFTGSPDGYAPLAGLVADPAGNLYGTTGAGGGSPGGCGGLFGCGTVFELTPPSYEGGDWTETILFAFQDGSNDGGSPEAPLILDAGGNLYGTTYKGGAFGAGTVFELSPPLEQGGAWTETVLYSFPLDAGNPISGLVLDGQGNLYGETYPPDVKDQVFELSPPAIQGGSWTFSVLFTFSTRDEGIGPRGGLSLDGNGNLYGTCFAGGTGDGPGCPGGSGTETCGLVFELVRPTSQGGVWTEKVLHNFTGTHGDGAMPYSGVVFHGGNHLVGTTARGGDLRLAQGGGTVFELSPGDHGWTGKILYQFGSNAYYPETSVIFDRQGNLYGGTNYTLGNNLDGQVFELSPPAVQGAFWSYTTLYQSSCCGMDAGLSFDKAGSVLYGTTPYGGSAFRGSVFAITP